MNLSASLLTYGHSGVTFMCWKPAHFAKELNSELWNIGPLSDFITSGMP